MLAGRDLSGPAWISVRAPGLAERILDVDGSDPGTLALGDVALEPFWTLCGQVRDLSGHPVAGARITVRKKDPPWYPAFDAPRPEIGSREVTAADDGRFVITSRTGWSKDTCERFDLIRATVAGCASSWITVSLKAPMDLRLEPVRMLRGRLVWSFDDTPVEQVLLRVIDPGDPDRFENTMILPDDEGRFNVLVARDRDIDLAVYKTSRGRDRALADRIVPALRAVTDLGTVLLEGPAALLFDVRCDFTGNPVPGTLVRIGRPGFEYIDVLSDASGQAVFEGLPAGIQVQVRYLLEGEDIFCYKRRRRSEAAWFVETGAAGSRKTVTLKADRSHVKPPDPEPPKRLIAGSVTDPAGNPLAGARIVIDKDGLPPTYSGKTRDEILAQKRHYMTSGVSGGRSGFNADDQGRFTYEMTFIPEVHKLRSIHARAEGYWPRKISGDALESLDLEALSFVLTPHSEWIDGCVIDNEGHPVSGAQVTCRYEDVDFGRIEFGRTADPGGRFRFPLRSRCPLSCSAHLEGIGKGELSGEAGDFTAGLIITLEPDPEEDPPSPRYPMKVRCLSDRGRPMPGVEVTAYARKGESFWRGVDRTDWFKKFTDRDGRVTVESDRLQKNPVRCCIKSTRPGLGHLYDLLEVAIPLTPGPEEQVIELPAGQPLRVTLIFQGLSQVLSETLDFLPVKAVFVLVNEDSGGSFPLVEPLRETKNRNWSPRHWRITHGSDALPALLAIRYVPAGVYRLRAEFPGYHPYRSEPFEVLDAAETGDIEARLVLDDE